MSSSLVPSGFHNNLNVNPSDSVAALTLAQQQEVAQLQAVDREVHSHEQAHLAVAGGLATSGARFTYERGPNGKRYAVAGEVSIDTSAGATPEETLARAQRIQQAALAPANPSPQDRRVAAEAAQQIAQAEAQLREQQAQQNSAPSATGPSFYSATGESIHHATPAFGDLINTYA